MSIYTASEVAKWFLAYNRSIMSDTDADTISNLKLQKLLYYAQGTFLVVNDGVPLFKDPIVAWAHGPVVECVYHEYKECGSTGIDFDENFDFTSFETKDHNLLIEVYNNFAQFSAWKLRDMTHEERPWKETERNEFIPRVLIKEFFIEEYITQ